MTTNLDERLRVVVVVDVRLLFLRVLAPPPVDGPKRAAVQSHHVSDARQPTGTLENCECTIFFDQSNVLMLTQKIVCKFASKTVNLI